jgi:hypothetical protein
MESEGQLNRYLNGNIENREWNLARLLKMFLHVAYLSFTTTTT